jgi:hypothetical protein
MDLDGFVASQLPALPARLLEVGCGRGALTRAIAGWGDDGTFRAGMRRMGYLL